MELEMGPVEQTVKERFAPGDWADLAHVFHLVRQWVLESERPMWTASYEVRRSLPEKFCGRVNQTGPQCSFWDPFVVGLPWTEKIRPRV